ncbi:MAG: DUF2085 domain-containing protein [Myxococcales bacterium]|nr:DUF2085 domain-containing protein [Myxococcales bacterium]
MWAILEGFAGHFCHRIPQRSLSADGVQCLFCYRCVGFYTSFVSTSILLILCRHTKLNVKMFCIGIAFIIISIIDSVVEPGNNLRRVVLGNIGGVGFAVAIIPVFWQVFMHDPSERGHSELTSPVSAWLLGLLVLFVQCGSWFVNWNKSLIAVVFLSVLSVVGILSLLFVANVFCVSRIVRKRRRLTVALATLLVPFELILIPITRSIVH